MFQSSLIMSMCLGAINCAVSKEKYVLIMQMSNSSWERLRKIIINYKSCGRNRTFAFAILVWKFPLPTDEIQPPFKKFGSLIIKTWILNLDKVCNAM